MKKLLLLFIISNFVTNAQVLLTEDFESYTIGNIGTDFAGTNPGQGNWYTRTLAPLNGNNNFQIVDNGDAYGKVIKITGFEGANVASPTAVTTNSRFMYKDISSDWSFRDIGNDIAEVEYDFFTGPATTSSNIMRVALYDGPTNVTTTKVLAGVLITMNPFTLRGVGHYDPVANGSTGAVGAYSFGMVSNGATPPVFSELTLTANTWYRIGFSYNYVTGEMKFAGAGISRNSVQGAASGTNVNNITLIATTGGTATLPNTASATGTFDNILVRTTATNALLAVDTVESSISTFSVSPNPSNDFVIVSSKNNKILNLEMTDVNGRIVKTVKVGNLNETNVNISDLSSGVYMMKITSENGSAIKKIIKN
jgi:Secretion system C-terminal sorting domain